MGTIWLLFACVAITSADVGYQYNNPSSSSSFSTVKGGTSFGSSDSSTGGHQAFGGVSGGSQNAHFSSQQNTASFNVPSQNVNGFVNNNYESSFATSGSQPLPKINSATNFLNSYGEPLTGTGEVKIASQNTKSYIDDNDSAFGYRPSVTSQNGNQGSFNTGNSRGTSGSFGSNFETNSFDQNTRFGSTSSVGFVQQTQEPIIKKHFYVHVAPEDPPVQTFRQAPVLPPPEKHYKIIFVKVPSQDVQRSAVVQQAPQIEEKTIVYVLVNKQEELEALEVPAPKPTEPSKPEVYFIKYNSQKKLNEVAGGASTLGGGLLDTRINSDFSTGLNKFSGTDSATSISTSQKTSGQSVSDNFSQSNVGFLTSSSGGQIDQHSSSNVAVKGASVSTKVSDQGPLLNTLTTGQGSIHHEEKGFKTYGTPKLD